MSASLLYRIAAVLLVLFAVGHQLGFRKVDPKWGVDAYVEGLKTTRFLVQGWSRTYWGFYAGFGTFVTVLLVFSAILAWQLGALPVLTLQAMPLLLWSFAACYVVITVLTWRSFFKAPVLFCIPISLALVIAAWQVSAGAA